MRCVNLQGTHKSFKRTTDTTKRLSTFFYLFPFKIKKTPFFIRDMKASLAYMYSKKINKFILSFIIQYNRVWIKIC